MNTKLNQEESCDCEDQEDNQQHWTELGMQLTKLKVRLDDVIQDPKYYRNILDRIEMLGENDEVELVLDTIGGNLDGCIALCDAIQSTPATVTAVLLNKIFSAGSAIALCCDNVEVRPNARMMLHSWSGNGFSGKSHEIKADWQFNEKYNENFLWSCYKDFLTEEEFQTMQNGTDFWLSAEQVIERLERRIEIQQARDEEEEELDPCQLGEECKSHEGCVTSCNPAPPKPQYNPKDASFNRYSVDEYDPT